MTLDEMAAEVVEGWTRTDPEMVAKWDRNRLWDRAERLCKRIKAEARESGRPLSRKRLHNSGDALCPNISWLLRRLARWSPVLPPHDQV